LHFLNPSALNHAEVVAIKLRKFGIAIAITAMNIIHAVKIMKNLNKYINLKIVHMDSGHFYTMKQTAIMKDAVNTVQPAIVNVIIIGIVLQVMTTARLQPVAIPESVVLIMPPMGHHAAIPEEHAIAMDIVMFQPENVLLVIMNLVKATQTHAEIMVMSIFTIIHHTHVQNGQSGLVIAHIIIAIMGIHVIQDPAPQTP
jgi:hypothetical protein